LKRLKTPLLFLYGSAAHILPGHKVPEGGLSIISLGLLHIGGKIMSKRFLLSEEIFKIKLILEIVIWGNPNIHYIYMGGS